MKWGDWVYDAIPSVGDYIQVETQHDITGTHAVFEGEIEGFFGTVSWFVGELPCVYSPWKALRWRKKIGEEGTPTEQVRELESA